MVNLAIPSLLLDKLENLETKGQAAIIETGSDVAPIVIRRSLLLSQSSKKRGLKHSSPETLLLMSQDNLVAYLEKGDNSLKKEFTFLSEENSPKSDVSLLNRRVNLLATTAQRAIDHLRRGNLNLEKSRYLIIGYDFDQQEDLDLIKSEFLDDCRFIFTKVNKECHIELYTPTLDSLTREPEEILSRALVVRQQDWETPLQNLEIYNLERQSTKAILDILYAKGEDSYFIIQKTKSRWYNLKSKIESSSIKIRATGCSVDQLPNYKKRAQDSPYSLVIIDQDANQLLEIVRRLRDLRIEFSTIVAIVNPKQQHLITTSKETLLMNAETKEHPNNDEVLAGKIKLLVEKLNVDSNPEQLENLKKIIRKNVPFYRRGHFSAYLFRELFLAKERTQKAHSTPRNSKTLYLNIGKMRRLYAKELSQIIQKELNISRSDIFSIRIHDNTLLLPYLKRMQSWA